MARLMGMSTSWRDVDHATPRSGSIEFGELKGSPGPDRIHGSRDNDTIDGRGGDDVLGGRYGYDILSGGAGNDVLRGGSEQQEHGGAGRDLLDGGAGDDRLFGGFESDGLTGGAGKDRFMYTALSDTTLELSDTILDFEQGKDRLVFRDEFRDEGGLHFIGDAEFSRTPGEVRFAVYTDQSQVLIDWNGDGMTDSRIVFSTEITFQASDFSF